MTASKPIPAALASLDERTEEFGIKHAISRLWQM
jgi:hypothetical protein